MATLQTNQIGAPCPTDWEWAFQSVPAGQPAEAHYAGAFDRAAVPALAELAVRMAAAGYAPVSTSVRAWQTRTSGIPDIYHFDGYASFDKGDGRVKVRVTSPEATTLALAAEMASVKPEDIVFVGDPVAGGDGQARRCFDIARRLLQEHGAFLGAGGQVVVRYCTRGGRGGWNAKIAERAFSPSDLAEARPQRTARQTAPSIRATLQTKMYACHRDESEPAWSKPVTRTVSLVRGHVSVARVCFGGVLTADAEPTEADGRTWRVLRYFERAHDDQPEQRRGWWYLWRMPEADYLRLVAKAGAAPHSS